VKEILKANIADLKNTLQNIGFSVKEFSISLLGDSLNGNGFNNFNNEFNFSDEGIVKENIEEIIDMDDVYFRENGYLNYLV